MNGPLDRKSDFIPLRHHATLLTSAANPTRFYRFWVGEGAGPIPVSSPLFLFSPILSSPLFFRAHTAYLCVSDRSSGQLAQTL